MVAGGAATRGRAMEEGRMERPQPSATGKADRSVVGPVHAVHLQPRVEWRGVAVQVLLQGIVKIIAAILILT